MNFVSYPNESERTDAWLKGHCCACEKLQELGVDPDVANPAKPFLPLPDLLPSKVKHPSEAPTLLAAHATDTLAPEAAHPRMPSPTSAVIVEQQLEAAAFGGGE